MMTELDFLPDWYQVRQERRRGYFVFVWLGACLLTVMGLWFYLANSHIGQCRADLHQLQKERNLVNEQLLKIDKLRVVRDDLTRKSQIADKLHHRPDVVHVTSRLIELTPDDVSLVELEFQTEKLKDSMPAGAPATPRRISSGRSSPAPATTRAPTSEAIGRTRYLLKITGVAPVDVTIANFIARLSGSEAFTDVQMDYTKDVKRSGRLMRQFEVTCQLVENWRSVSSGDGPAASAAPAPETGRGW